MGDRPIVADLRLESLLPAIRSQRPARLAVIAMHTSPTAPLGRSANGGLNVYVREVCRLLGERGVATDIFSRRRGAEPDIEHLGPLSRVIYLDAGGPELDKYQLVDQVEEFADRIEDIALSDGAGYDLLYSHYWLSGAAACTLRGRLGVPWVHTAHTWGFIKNARLARGDQPEPVLRLLLEAEISRAADLLVVSTPAEQGAVARTHGVRLDRVTVITPGVDLATFGRRPRTEALSSIGCLGSRVVLFVGRLERLKGAEIAIKAFAQASAGHPDAVLIVAGDDSSSGGESERSRLQAVAAELGVSSGVRFEGSVAQSRLAAYYAAAEACLMPSYTESFGLVGLEAQACGCPLIASSAAGLAAVVRDGVTGYLVEGDDPALYAERLSLLLAGPEQASQMGRRAALLAQRFSWDRTVDRLQSAFAPLLRAPQAGVQARSLQE